MVSDLATTPDIVFQTLGLLCALGAATFATTIDSRRAIAAVVVGFLAGLWLAPAPEWTGTVVALVAALHLARPGLEIPPAAFSGLLAGLWSTILHGAGTPLAIAVALAAAVPGASAWMSRHRSDFAPVRLREEALLLVGGLGLTVAVASDVAEGWRSARVLNLEPGGGAGGGIAGWVLAVGGAAAMAGGAHTLWRRR